MRYYILTLGCQMNKSDSQRIARVLEGSGYKPAPTEVEADLIVVNACSVRQSAVDRIYGKLKLWQGRRIFITGCLLPQDREKLAKKVDLIFNIKDLPKLAKLICPKTKRLAIDDKDYLKIPPLLPITHYSLPRHKCEAFVPIMTGCDNFCSYCVVPYTRGREYSRKEKEIISEVKNLVERGYEEITLLGQNVNSFKPSFVELLKKLVKLPFDFKIKFLTSNPWDFSDDLIELIAKEPKISQEIHLPVQSGDDEILKKMNRKYTRKEYLNLVKKLRKSLPNLSLSTDLIVGFPGETKKAFENTVSLCQKAKFDKAYISCYSPRPQTAAYKLKDDVPLSEKKRRWKILNELINQKQKGDSPPFS